MAFAADEDLAREWMADPSAARIAEKFGIGKQTVVARISFLRRKGVALPRAKKKGEAVDVDGLNKLIESLGNGSSKPAAATAKRKRK